MIAESKRALFSKKILVDENKLLDLIDEIRNDLPESIEKAQGIIDNYEEIMKDAKNKRNELLDRDELCVEAAKKANIMLSEARKNSCEIKKSTLHYADSMLEEIEKILSEIKKSFCEKSLEIENKINESIKTIESNRRELRDND